LTRRKGKTKLLESAAELNKLLGFLQSVPKKSVQVGDSVAVLQVYPEISHTRVVIKGFLTPSKITEIEKVDNLEYTMFENGEFILNPYDFENFDAEYLVNLLFFDTDQEAKKMVNILQLKFSGELTIGTGMLKS
jgi:hypothetical protein